MSPDDKRLLSIGEWLLDCDDYALAHLPEGRVDAKGWWDASASDDVDGWARKEQVRRGTSITIFCSLMLPPVPAGCLRRTPALRPLERSRAASASPRR